MEANSPSELVTGQRVPAAKAEGCQSTLFVPVSATPPGPAAESAGQGLTPSDLWGLELGINILKQGVGGRAPRFRFLFLKARNAL